MDNETEPRDELSATLRRHLDVIEACAQSGEPLKRYAERMGLSIHTLYQAKKELRKKGVLPPRQRPGGKVRKPRRGVQRAARFVEAVPRRSEGAAVNPAWRLRLPTGVVFEVSG
ncbi:MAG: transposase [Hyphomicrobiaceae bacterium]|jgi:transposase